MSLAAAKCRMRQEADYFVSSRSMNKPGAIFSGSARLAHLKLFPQRRDTRPPTRSHMELPTWTVNALPYHGDVITPREAQRLLQFALQAKVNSVIVTRAASMRRRYTG